MHDKHSAATKELAFELGRITRQASHQANGAADEGALAKFAESVLEAGEGAIDADLLLIFVSGFQDTIPVSDRRTVGSR